MNEANNIIDVLLTKTGQIVTLETVRDVKVKKGMPNVQKHSRFQCRIGVNYDNIQSVKDKREDGTLPEENAGLPWGEWEVFPYVIAHKGEKYLRCSTVDSGNMYPPTFMSDGKQIGVDEVRNMAYASEFSNKDGQDVFNIKVSSIVGMKG